LLLALMAYLVGFDETVEAVGQVGLAALLSLGAVKVVLLTCQAGAWTVLNRAIGHRVGFSTLLGATTAGMAGNMLTPSTYLGGEPVKVLYAGRRTGLPYEQLAGTVLLMKYVEALSFVVFVVAATVLAVTDMGRVLFGGANIVLGVSVLVVAGAAVVMLAVLWVSLARGWLPLTVIAGLLARAGFWVLVVFVTVLAVAAMCYVLLGGASSALGVAVLAVAGGAVVLLALLWVSLICGWLPPTVMARLLARVGPFLRFFSRLRVRARRVELQASRVFRQERRMVVPAFCLFLLTHAAMYVKPLLFFGLGWGVSLSAGQLGLIFLTCQVLLAFQFTPGGVGTMDGGLFGMLAITGIAITHPQCAAYLLCMRFWDGLVIAAGAMLATRVGVGLFAEPKPES